MTTTNNRPGPARDRAIIEAHRAGKTYREIGAQFGISAYRANQIVLKHERRGTMPAAAPKPVTPKPLRVPSLSRALLSHDDLRDLGITYSRWSLTRLVKEGRFPAPVALGPGPGPAARKALRAAEVEAWLAALPKVAA